MNIKKFFSHKKINNFFLRLGISFLLLNIEVSEEIFLLRTFVTSLFELIMFSKNFFGKFIEIKT